MGRGQNVLRFVWWFIVDSMAVQSFDRSVTSLARYDSQSPPGRAVARVYTGTTLRQNGVRPATDRAVV